MILKKNIEQTKLIVFDEILFSFYFISTFLENQNFASQPQIEAYSNIVERETVETRRIRQQNFLTDVNNTTRVEEESEISVTARQPGIGMNFDRNNNDHAIAPLDENANYERQRPTINQWEIETVEPNVNLENQRRIAVQSWSSERVERIEPDPKQHEFSVQV